MGPLPVETTQAMLIEDGQPVNGITDDRDDRIREIVSDVIKPVSDLTTNIAQKAIDSQDRLRRQEATIRTTVIEAVRREMSKFKSEVEESNRREIAKMRREQPALPSPLNLPPLSSAQKDKRATPRRL